MAIILVIIVTSIIFNTVTNLDRNSVHIESRINTLVGKFFYNLTIFYEEYMHIHVHSTKMLEY